LAARPPIYWLAAIAILAATAGADEPLHRRIDLLIALASPEHQAQAAPASNDEEFVRRVWLDLAGSIPPVALVRAFLADADPQKREKLIDRLLASPEHARQMQRVFDLALMRRLPQKHVEIAAWEKFLRESFAQNKPWDQVVREILSADGADPNNRGPARFYLDREGDVHTITKDVGRLFLGVNFDCAQCHNHPQIEDYLQDDYYGVSAFFVRSFVMTDKEKRVIFAEKAEGEVSYESAFEIRDKISKGPKSTGPRLFAGLAISEPKFEKPEEAYLVKPDEKDKTLRPVPRFSRRAKFAEFVASAENRRFCRTTANRLWSIYFGRGLVHPVDHDHTGNPPSHPLLLALLTEECAQRRFDLRALTREILLSQTYQRSSRGSASDQADPPPAAFLRAELRPLSPAQFAWAVLEATGEAEVQRAALGAQLSEQALFDKLAGYEQRFVQLFGGQPGTIPSSFESSTDQVLFLANDSMIGNLLKPRPGNLADRLLKLPDNHPAAIAEELFLSVLSRRPAPEEVEDVQNYLAGQAGDARAAAISELIWALVASAEFRFIH
jgi:hypothetical protein